VHVSAGQDIAFVPAKAAERSKLSGQNFFGKHVHPKFATGAPCNLLNMVFRFAFDPLAKAFRPRKPYVLLARAVKLERNKPVRLT
jgi:hypothetical protein